MGVVVVVFVEEMIDIFFVIDTRCEELFRRGEELPIPPPRDLAKKVPREI